MTDFEAEVRKRIEPPFTMTRWQAEAFVAHLMWRTPHLIPRVGTPPVTSEQGK